MRRFLVTFVLVASAALLAGAILGTFLLGGKSFVGFPFPIVQWSRSLPPIPGVESGHGGLDLSLWGLMLDVGLWVSAAVLMSRRRARPSARSRT